MNVRVFGALGLIAGVVAYVVWQRPVEPPPVPKKPFVVQYANGTELWRGSGPLPLGERVRAELQRSVSVPLEELLRTGATVVTTIDLKTQTAGATVLAELPKDAPEHLLVAVESASGDVKAYLARSGATHSWPVADEMLRGSGVLGEVSGADGGRLHQTQSRSAFGSTLRVGEACGGAMCGTERGTAWTIGSTPRYEVAVFVNDGQVPPHAVWQRFAALLEK